MIFSSDIETDDLIIETLAKGEMRVKELHSHIEPTHEVTLQAVYNALNQLIDAGVVWKTGTIVGLSKEWTKKVAEGLHEKREEPELLEGESVIYTFSSLGELDKYWKHLTLLVQDVDPHYPVFFTDPHQMWGYVEGRDESEDKYMRSFTEKERYAFTTLGGKTMFDKEYRKNYASDFLQIELRPEVFERRDLHLTIIGDYLFYTLLSSDIAIEIDKIYDESGNESVLEEKLIKLFSTPQKTKIRLLKDKERAKRLRKKFAKPFYIPRELREKYDLF